MKLRQLSIIAGVAIFLGAIFLFRILAAGSGDDEPMVINGQPSIGVPVVEASPEAETANIIFTGRVIPEDEIELFAEVTGNLQAGDKPFKAGTSFKTGEVIIAIDDREYQQSVLNQKSQFQSLLTQVLADINIDFPEEYQAWSDYLLSMDLNENLEELPASSDRTFNLFLAGRNIPANYYSIKQSEVRLSKYQIVAPFDGVVTENLLNAGTLVRANQMLGTFTKTGTYEIEASVNAGDRFFIAVGDRVTIEAGPDNETKYQAEVVRINSAIDENTQTVQVFFRTRLNSLLPGQYVTGIISGQRFENADVIATKVLVRNDMLFVVEDSVATLRRVKVLANTRDSSIVQGVVSGELIINEFRDASFEGTKVSPIYN